MNGTGPICLKVDQHTYHEHASLASARAEARRLATTLGSDIVVYAPIYRVTAPREATEQLLPQKDFCVVVPPSTEELPF